MGTERTTTSASSSSTPRSTGHREAYRAADFRRNLSKLRACALARQRMYPMRTPWKIALVSALVLTVLFGLSSPASAYHTVVVTNETGTVADNTVVIPMNHSRGYTFVLAAGGSIQYGIQSRSGNFALFF